MQSPARNIDRYKVHKRDRWANPEELPKLAQAIDAEPNVYIRMALWLYLLTGVRNSELLVAQRADIDWNRQELRLDKTRTGRAHYVPLSASATTRCYENCRALRVIPISRPATSTGDRW